MIIAKIELTRHVVIQYGIVSRRLESRPNMQLLTTFYNERQLN